jgi:hypothetical protein
MEAAAWQPQDEEDVRILDLLPPHVLAALDHLTRAERDGVLAAVRAFSHHEREGNAIPATESLYLLWAAPEVRVIVRRTSPSAPVEVEDVVRPSTLRALTEADAS